MNIVTTQDREKKARGKRITHNLNTMYFPSSYHKYAMVKFDFYTFPVTEHSYESQFINGDINGWKESHCAFLMCFSK